MTDFTWDGGGDNVAWSDEDNWDVGSGFPDDSNGDFKMSEKRLAVVTGAARTVGEVQINVGFTGSLTLTVGALTIDDAGAHDGSFNVDAGTFDANDLDISIDGDFSLASGGTIVMGAGSTWTCNGNWSSAVGTITEETSLVKLTGTGKTVAAGTAGARQLDQMEIATGATITCSSSGGVRPRTITINGTLTMTGTSLEVSTLITMGAAGVLDGTGTVSAKSGATITIGSGVITVANFTMNGNITINPGTYGSATVLAVPGTSGTRTLTFAAGTFIFSGDVTFQSNAGSGVYNVDMSTNNPAIRVDGDLTIDEQAGATLNFNKGTSTITFGGAALQTVISDGKDLGDVTITNVSAGGVTFADAVNIDVFTANAAAANIFVKFDEAGAHTVDEFAITGTGNFRVELASEVAANQWDVVTVGNQSVDHVEVQDSNMSGGTYTVTAGMDNGNNSANWVFVQAAFRTKPLVNAFRTQPVINAFRTQPVPM